MCPLIYKNFVLGYLAALMLLSLLIYLKVIVMVPRGLDYGVMAMLAVAVLLSRRLVLGGSLLNRILVLAGIAALFYLGSKLLYPKQYTLLTEPKDKDFLESLLDPRDELRSGKETSIVKLYDPAQNLSALRNLLKKEAPRPIYYLVLALVLLGICAYFILS